MNREKNVLKLIRFTDIKTTLLQPLACCEKLFKACFVVNLLFHLFTYTTSGRKMCIFKAAYIDEPNWFFISSTVMLLKRIPVLLKYLDLT